MKAKMETTTKTAWSQPHLQRYGGALLGALLLSAILVGLGLLVTSDGTGSSNLLVNQLFINAILVVGLHVFIGTTGVISFGHLGFATIAGYIVALLLMPVDRKLRQIPNAPFGAVEWSASPLEATLIAVVAVTLLALLLSFALTRSGQGTFAATIITLALLEIVNKAANNWDTLTGGGVGLGFIPKLQDRWPIVLVLILSIVAARLFHETRLGRWAKAAREDDTAANLIGVDARLPRTAALLLSVAIVSFGAALRVQDIGSMTPRLLFFDTTLLVLAMLIVGGRRSVTGALLGVLLITIGNEVTRTLGREWNNIPALEWLFRPTLPQLFLGGVMLLTMLFRPDGLIKDWEIDHLLRRRWRRWEDKPAHTDNPERQRSVRTLHVEAITVDFGGFRALNEVSLEVRSDEIVGLIGPNGAGKTTLLNVITGYVRPTSGQVRLDEQVLTGRAPHQIAHAGIARTFQNLRLFKGLEVRENVAVAAIAAPRLRGQDVEAEINRLLLQNRLWEQRYARAEELDYGNQRRLELARAGATIPDFLLLDEPTSGMSDDESAVMIDHIRQLARSVGAGVLVIDHDLHFITHLCDRVYVLDYGMLIASGTPDIIRQDERVRIAYLGSG